MKFGSWKICAVCALVLSTAFVCQADTIYGFSIFNNADWASDSRLNFTVAISDEGQNKVSFVFQNSSLISSSITAVYFDDKSLFEPAGDILNGSGVSFSAGAKPQSLPAGNELDPTFTKKPFFAADSDSPTSSNGINPGEWLKITFSLNAGKNFDSVIEQIDADCSRIGIHIQSLPNGNSVSAINSVIPNPPVIPEPATVALLALGSIVFVKRRR